MKLLHTSDWHLGRSLYGRKRYAEFTVFLQWLAKTIEQEKIDVLLVAGDVFDTSAPSNKAQGLYYQFLCQIAASACRHVVIIAGNHDSPSFLNAPKNLLQALNVHVVGSITENIEDEIIVLNDANGEPELMVCAVPYLRDRDIRLSEVGEDISDKERKLMEGIKLHYADVCSFADKQRKKINPNIPLVAMGHLFAAGGRTIADDGVRELYVGSLAHVSSTIFPESVDYVALGHLHVPQQLNKSQIMRYCGSPIPMGFGEANQTKVVCTVSFSGREATVQDYPIPVFQKLKRVQGDLDDVFKQIQSLVNLAESIWLEVIYNGDDVVSDLSNKLEAITQDSPVDILRIKNTRVMDRVLTKIEDELTLDDLNEQDVFLRCLDANKITESQRPSLITAYQEVLSSLNDVDEDFCKK